MDVDVRGGEHLSDRLHARRARRDRAMASQVSLGATDYVPAEKGGAEPEHAYARGNPRHATGAPGG